MAQLPMFIYDDPILRRKAKPVRQVDDGLRKLAADMMETMHTAHGIGLAANQVGSLQRVIVVDVSGMEETPDVPPLVMLNPEVVREEGSWILEEGCLSIPDIREEVERPELVRLRFKDLEFRDHEIEARGILGRVILHELDHLNGVLFIDRLGAVRRKLLRGRLNKIRRGEYDVTYPVAAPSIAQASPSATEL